jgi:anti-sigma B factor antagonist
MLFGHVGAHSRLEAEMTEFAEPTAELLRVRRTDTEVGLTLELSGELDISTAATLEHELAEIEHENVPRVLIDLTNLSFMDSSGLALIVRAMDTARNNGYELWIRRGAPQVQRLLELSGLCDRLNFDD